MDQKLKKLRNLYEKYESLQEMPYINNEPIDNAKLQPIEPSKDDYKTREELTDEFDVGYKQTSYSDLKIIDIIERASNNVIGNMDMVPIEYDGKTYAVIKFVSLHSDYQGKGLGMKLYKWVLDKFDGLISDASLSKLRGKGSFHLWKKLSKIYPMYVVDWKQWQNYGELEFKKIKNIDGWVNKNKANYRLAVL
jgi:GNAT superfamily N-acetyltransferase